MLKKLFHLSFAPLVLISGTLSLTQTAHADTIVYSDLATFAINGVVNNGGAVPGSTAADHTTDVVAQGIAAATGLAGTPINDIEFSFANSNTTATAAEVDFVVYANNGSDAPGAILLSLTFNAITVPAGELELFTYDSPTALFDTPSGTFFVGEAFTDTATTYTKLNNLGQGLFGAATVGTSDSTIFTSSSAGVTANPAGTTDSDSGNLGFELDDTLAPVVVAPAATPEPSSISLLLLGVTSMGGIVRKLRRTA